MRRSPAQRLGRAAMAAFGAAAVSTTLGACGARGGLEIGVLPSPSPMDRGVDSGPFALPALYDAAFTSDAGIDDDVGAAHAEYGGPPFDAGSTDASFAPDGEELVLPAYGGPWFGEDAAIEPDASCEDPGCVSADYGGPPEP